MVEKLSLTLRGLAKWYGMATVVGYAFAWFGHFFVEKNRPATFKVSGCR